MLTGIWGIILSTGNKTVQDVGLMEERPLSIKTQLRESSPIQQTWYFVLES